MKAVFWLVITALAQISRLRFKQSEFKVKKLVYAHGPPARGASDISSMRLTLSKR